MKEPLQFVADAEERLDRFLARKLPEFSRSRLSEWISAGKVVVNGHKAKPALPLAPGMTVSLDPVEERPAHDLSPASIHLDVVYEDDALLVVNKPRGLATHPAPSLREPSLVNALLARSHDLSEVAGNFRPGIVHRLDKETTGLILVAKTNHAHLVLARQIEQKGAWRRYLGLAAGDLPEPRFDVSAPIARSRHNRLLMEVSPSGRPATTHFKRIARVPEGTLLGASLETGRTHQIRVHLRAIGHPVLGDRLYAPKELRDHPLQLHAAFLSFQHPTTGNRMALYAEPPEDFISRPLTSREQLENF